MIQVAIAGEGAFAQMHIRTLQALAPKADVELALLVGGVPDATMKVAEAHRIPRWTTDFSAMIGDRTIDAVVLATPTPLHADQAIACLAANKHVLVEIPMADSLEDAAALVVAHRAARERARVVAMVGHLRRFNRGHAWIHERIQRRELTLRQLDVQTYFLRRTNVNLLGEPRSWTDSLLWHHACHSVDLFRHQTGEEIAVARALRGPDSESLGIPLDLSIQLATTSRALATISLSFNHEGPPGSTFRYICSEGTFVARNDDLALGTGELVDTGDRPEGLACVQRELFAAITEKREPRASVEACLPTMEILDRLSRSMEDSRFDSQIHPPAS